MKFVPTMLSGMVTIYIIYIDFCIAENNVGIGVCIFTMDNKLVRKPFSSTNYIFVISN